MTSQEHTFLGAINTERVFVREKKQVSGMKGLKRLKVEPVSDLERLEPF